MARVCARAGPARPVWMTQAVRSWCGGCMGRRIGFSRLPRQDPPPLRYSRSQSITIPSRPCYYCRSIVHVDPHEDVGLIPVASSPSRCLCSRLTAFHRPCPNPDHGLSPSHMLLDHGTRDILDFYVPTAPQGDAKSKMRSTPPRTRTVTRERRRAGQNRQPSPPNKMVGDRGLKRASAR